MVCGGTNYYVESILFEELPEHFDLESFISEIDELRNREPGLDDLLASLRTNLPLDKKQEIEDTFSP